MPLQSVNLVVLSGVIDRCTTQHRDDGASLALGTLQLSERGMHGGAFTLYVPFEAYSTVADALHATPPETVVLLQGN